MYWTQYARQIMAGKDGAACARRRAQGKPDLGPVACLMIRVPSRRVKPSLVCHEAATNWMALFNLSSA